MGREVLKIALAAAFLAEFISEIATKIAYQIQVLGFGGKVDVLVVIALLLALWELGSAKFMAISERMNPHAKYWNSAVSAIVSAISLLFIYVIKNYIASFVSVFENTADFTAPTLIVLVIVGFLAIIALTVYFEEFHSISAFGRKSVTKGDPAKSH